MILFINSVFKGRAKLTLRNSYWNAFLVSLILTAASGGASIISNRSFNTSQISIIADNYEYSYFWRAFWPTFITSLVIVLIVSAIATVFKIFVANPLEVGAQRYFIFSSYYQYDLKYIGTAFKKTEYINVVKTMFLKNLYIFLWSLLFIIPGIIKSYEYMMVPYILAENPNIDHKTALQISSEMTTGHKMDLFLLGLSFIGWILLAILTCGIGSLFLNPYMYATYAESYRFLKEKKFPPQYQPNF